MEDDFKLPQEEQYYDDSPQPERVYEIPQGRSLISEVDQLSERVQMLYEAVSQLVDVQREANQNIQAALTKLIPDGVQ
ncbi:MAG: hypothetical protein WCC37_22760 [Candidatus Sulfotelmatobacter sp.]|jgi:hypothetical protein